MIRPLLALLLLAFALPLRAEVKLSALFSDQVVLPRGGRAPVWGTADPGATAPRQIFTTATISPPRPSAATTGNSAMTFYSMLREYRMMSTMIRL